MMDSNEAVDTVAGDRDRQTRQQGMPMSNITTRSLESYSPAIAQLLVEKEPSPLGPGQPDSRARAALQALRVETAFDPDAVRDPAMAAACLAGLWLRHNFLDESHRLSQNIATPTGSYWHGLMHRREPDFANAAYWFRQIGQHPVFPAVREAAAALAAANLDPASHFLAEQGVWDPFGFINLCERCLDSGSPLEALCRQVQQREWEILFDFCYQAATGTTS
jgi:hypothetical protein